MRLDISEQTMLPILYKTKRRPTLLKNHCQNEPQGLKKESIAKTTAWKRIEKELQELYDEPVPHYSAIGPVDNNDLFNWEATLQGPDDSPYKGGMFKIQIQFPVDYPFEQPTVRFATKIYHCNVLPDGSLRGLDLEDGKYCFSSSIFFLLVDLYDLLQNPNPWNTENPELAQMCISDRTKYDCFARTWTSKYAMVDCSETMSCSTPEDTASSSNSTTYSSSSSLFSPNFSNAFRKAALTTYPAAIEISNSSERNKISELDNSTHSLSNSCQTKNHVKKSVNFSNRKLVRLIPHLYTMPYKVITKCWYLPEDFAFIKTSYRKIVFLMDTSGHIDESIESSRGLENRTRDGARIRYQNRRDSYDAVLNEQQRQRKEDIENPYTISWLYQESNKKSTCLALARAEQDKRDVQDYLAEARKTESIRLARYSKGSFGNESKSVAIELIKDVIYRL